MVNVLNQSRFKAPALALAVSGFALTGSATFAQEADDEARAVRSGVDTIIVQATKTAQDSQTVPVAVTAVTGKALEQRFAQDFRDLTSAAPNVLLEPVGSFQNASSFFIRGAGSSDIESAADPGIAVLIDGVYQARTSTALVDFVDVSAVEILRGPQGTLFGRNAIGGAVLLRHNAPDVDEFGADVALTIGQYGRLDIKGMVNLVLAEGKSAFRVAFKSTNLDGYYTNLYDGEDIGEIDRMTILPSWRFQNDNLDIVIRGEVARIRDDAYPTTAHNACRTDPANPPVDEMGNLLPTGNDVVINLSTLFGGGENARQYCAFEPDDRKRAYTVNHDQVNGDYSNFDIWGITGEINYNIPDVGTITYIGNYRDVDEDVHNDFDTTEFDLFSTRRVQRHWQTSHELRFASEFSDVIDFVAGFYYFEQHYVLEQNTYGAIVGHGGGLGTSIFGRSEQWHDQWAIFGEANWHITDQFTLSAGARYTEETKDFLHCGVGFGDAATRTCAIDAFIFDSSTDIGDGPGQNPGTNNWSNVSPKVSLNYQATDNMYFYASWTRGFRSGGFNGRGNFPSTAGPFNEEKADSYEVGMKWDTADNRVRINLTGFWTEFDDLQRTIIRPALGGGGGQETVTENAAKARSRGFELEVTAVPTDGLTLGMALGYLDATTLDWCADLNGPGVDTPDDKEPCDEMTEVAPGVYLEPFQNGGLPILRAPKWTFNLNAAYEFELGNAGFLTLSADYLHRSSMSLISAGFPPGTADGVDNYNGVNTTATRKATDVLNLQATWEDVNSQFHISFFWKNVTGETYINSGTYVAGLFNFAQRNVPRHWGFELGARF